MTKTKFHPILFSTPMVQAILDGRKTQTRRVVKDALLQNATKDDDLEFLLLTIIKKYKVGDVLWVRETFVREFTVDVFDREQFSYKADSNSDEIINLFGGKWKPSIFMPKEACRIFLKINSIRVERLQEITEEDAIAEGVLKIADYGATGYLLYTEPEASYSDIDAVYSFESLWVSINKKGSWDANPFVFAYEFEQIEKPLDFI